MNSPVCLTPWAGRGKLLWEQRTPAREDPGEAGGGGSGGGSFTPCHNGDSSFLFGDWKCDLLPCNEEATSAFGWKTQV